MLMRNEKKLKNLSWKQRDNAILQIMKQNVGIKKIFVSGRKLNKCRFKCVDEDSRFHADVKSSYYDWF